MNEFMDQFLIEARELVEQATDDLLALEERPGDAGRLDSAFRAFHTLKGSAGIVDFDAMARALHAVEDSLASIRAAAGAVPGQVVEDCLEGLDQVGRWLDAMQADGEPPASAESDADQLVARFTAPATGPAPTQLLAQETWAAKLRGRFPDQARQATAVVRYVPDGQCFFLGEDPLAVIGRMPGLLAVQIDRGGQAQPLSSLDPFTCQLSFALLARCSVAEAKAALAGVKGQIDVAPVEESASQYPPLARTMLEAQLRLLDNPEPDGLAGRMAAAGQAAANILRAIDEATQAAEVERAQVAAQAMAEPSHLLAALRRVLHTAAAPPEAGPAAAPASGSDAPALTLRVDVARIDALVRLAGELTVIKNGFGHIAGQARNMPGGETLAAALKDQHGQLDRLIADLQCAVLGIRVLPMGHVFQRFPRLVRDIGAGLGKPVRLELHGTDTEADKAIVEALFEPLLHVMRNALDHGIEAAVDRARLGKPATALLRLSAYRQSEHVVVEVQDDGAGLDIARVRQVAAARGVADPATLAAMPDSEVAELIFAPGFSTAATVSELSGRGVGMDAVRTAIERLGGRVGVHSEAGRGTGVRFTLPFTVMISRLLTLTAGGQAFGIPLEAVVETVRLLPDRIHALGAATAFVFRDRTVPICDLATLLGLDAPVAPAAGGTIVVVVQAAGELTGLSVDRVGKPLDVMLKPLEGLLSGAPGVAGTTLLGNGQVLIVLDVEALLA